MRHAALCILVACGSAPAPVAVPPPMLVVAPTRAAEPDRARIVAAHRVLESEQQDAFAASCSERDGTSAARCLPSCYAKEAADTRAGKQLHGAVEITHVACTAGDAAAIALTDELDRGTLVLRRARGRFPAAHKAGTWQAEVERALAVPPLPRGDVLRVTSDWRERVHPITQERLRCVTVSHYARALHHPLDGCGGDGALACEATGNAAAHGINVIHYRLAEARALQAANRIADCQQAALEAIAVARGLPRWRQYVTLNIAKWVAHAGYRTRFDGTLDEDALFARAASLGSEAELVHAGCGGAAHPQTTAAQEQSFHTCW